MKYDIFLSYNYKDSEFATIIAQYLSELGLSIWFDLWSAIPGSNYIATSFENLNNTEVIAVLIGGSPLSKFVEEEINFGLDSNRIKIVPVLIPGSSDSNIPPSLKDRRFIDLREGMDSLTNLDVLISQKQIHEEIEGSAHTQEILKLIADLKNPDHFVNSWNKNEYTIKKQWASIESNSNFRVIDIYKKEIDSPELCKNDEFLLYLAELLTDMNYIPQSVKILNYLSKYYSSLKDYSRLQQSLCDLAWSLYLQGENSNALRILKRQEEICINHVSDKITREGGLQRSYGYQAGIYEDAGDFTQALYLYHKQQQICLEIGDEYWMQISIGNEGLLEKKRGNIEAAWNFFKEKENISKKIMNLQGLQWAYNYQGDVCLEKKNYDLALQLFKKQEEIARQIGYYRGLLLSLYRQEHIFEMLQNDKQQLKIRQEILKLLKFSRS
jgi:tetratricopeptide (TPR) repeat protein